MREQRREESGIADDSGLFQGQKPLPADPHATEDCFYPSHAFVLAMSSEFS
jgi:hypothetical protein